MLYSSLYTVSMQGPVLLLSMCTVMLYAFLQPYHRLSVNLLEVFTMVVILLLIMISTAEQFKVKLHLYDDPAHLL